MKNKSWHGDSTAYVKTWESIGKPGQGMHYWNGITIDFRDYRLYTGRMQPYSRQWKSHKKLELDNYDKNIDNR
jgi:hypothetical protein